MTEPVSAVAGAPPAVAPVREESRIVALDVARAVALFGILLMNISGFGGPPYTYSDPTNGGGDTGINLWTWITTTMFFEGTQRGLFTLLFGAGIVLLTRSLEASGRPHAADIYFRRNLWLVVFGLIHAYLLLWIGEILFFYGVTALFVYGLRNAGSRTLVGIAVGGLLLSAAWSGLEAYNGLERHRAFVEADSLKTAGDSLTAEQSGAIEAWNGMLGEFKPDSAKIQKELDAKRGSYWDVLTFQAPQVVRWESYGLYRYFFDFFSMMLLGIVLFRTGIFTGTAPPRVYAWMIGLGYGIGLAVNYGEVTHLLAHDFSVPAILRTNISYDLGRIPLTLGHLAVVMLFAHHGAFAGFKRALAAVGRMAFTNYILTSVLCALLFFGFGFGLYGHLERHQLMYVVGGIWLLQLIVSPLWLARYRMGPLEWLWRWLSYGEKPAMRKG